MTSNTKTAATYVQKGGVGKTTSAAHLATAAVTDHDLNTVLIDLAGTQNDLATQFGILDDIRDPDAPISAVFGEDWDFISSNIPDIVDRMVYATGEGPDLIPADSGVTGADSNLASVPMEQRYLRLNSFINEHLADRYDLVIFDLPGKEDNITLNGILAAEHIVAPISPGSFEREQLSQLREDLGAIRDDLAEVLDANGIDPHLELIIPTMIDGRTKQAERFVDELAETFPALAAHAVAKSQSIANLQAEGGTLFDASDDELYATGRRAREAYRDNTDRLLDQLNSR